MEYIESLQGKRVVFTGRLEVNGEHMSRAAAIGAARRCGAQVSSNHRAKVSRFTDLLVRGYSPLHAHGEWGDDEEAVARLQSDGVDIAIIDEDGFGALLDGGWAPVLKPRSHAPRLPKGCLDYRPANPEAESRSVEIAVRDLTAALQAHNRLQEAIGRAARSAGHRVVSGSRYAAFDVGWEGADGRLHIVEVKSLEDPTDSAQLRLGLGQLLDYWERLHPAFGYLAVTRPPAEYTHWKRVCASVDVRLVVPNEVSGLFG